MRRAALVGLLVALPALGGWDLFRAPDEAVEAGNARYRAGDYDGAVAEYDRVLAREGAGDRHGVHFNRGAALYRKATAAGAGAPRDTLLDDAEREFRRATDTRDRQLAAAAYYNLGNTLFQRARYQQAIDAYKNALRANPGRRDARHNLELALRRRRQQQDQPQQDPQQQDQQQQNQQQQDPQQQDQPQQDQPQQDQPQQDQPQQDQQQQDEDQQQQQQRQDQDHQQPQRGRERETPDGHFEAKSDRDKKLDELERRSRRLRLLRMKRTAGRQRARKSERDY